MIKQRLLSLFGPSFLERWESRGPPRVLHTVAVCRDPVTKHYRVINIVPGVSPKSSTDWLLLSAARAASTDLLTTGKILRDEPLCSHHDCMGAVEGLWEWRSFCLSSGDLGAGPKSAPGSPHHLPKSSVLTRASDKDSFERLLQHQVLTTPFALQEKAKCMEGKDNTVVDPSLSSSPFSKDNEHSSVCPTPSLFITAPPADVDTASIDRCQTVFLPETDGVKAGRDDGSDATVPPPTLSALRRALLHVLDDANVDEGRHGGGSRQTVLIEAGGVAWELYGSGPNPDADEEGDDSKGELNERRQREKGCLVDELWFSLYEGPPLHESLMGADLGLLSPIHVPGRWAQVTGGDVSMEESGPWRFWCCTK